MKTEREQKKLPLPKGSVEKRAQKVAGVHVWARKRTMSGVETPIFYATVRIPGQKPRRVSTRHRLRSSAAQYAALLLRSALNPPARSGPEHPPAEQLELPPPRRMKPETAQNDSTHGGQCVDPADALRRMETTPRAPRKRFPANLARNPDPRFDALTPAQT